MTTNSAADTSDTMCRAGTAKVLVLAGVAEVGSRRLKEFGYQVIEVDNQSPGELRAAIAEADAVLARTEPYPADLLDTAPNLKIIARYGVGTDAIDVPAATARGIWVTVSKDCNTRAVAEHTLTLMLACAKQLGAQHAGTTAGDWGIRDRIETIELSGKTLGVIGLGAIGLEVARMAYDGFGMSILGYDAYLDASRMPDYIRVTHGLDEIYQASDVITLHVPATPQTRGMIGADVLDRLKPGAILVNTARGGIVVEDALFDALATGKLRAAGLDVFEVESAGTHNRLFELPNLIATPHVGGMAKEARDAMACSAAEAIHAVLSGTTPAYPINDPRK